MKMYNNTGKFFCLQTSNQGGYVVLSVLEAKIVSDNEAHDCTNCVSVRIVCAIVLKVGSCDLLLWCADVRKECAVVIWLRVQMFESVRGLWQEYLSGLCEQVVWAGFAWVEMVCGICSDRLLCIDEFGSCCRTERVFVLMIVTRAWRWCENHCDKSVGVWASMRAAGVGWLCAFSKGCAQMFHIDASVDVFDRSWSFWECRGILEVVVSNW